MGRKPQPILRCHRISQDSRARNGMTPALRSALAGFGLGILISIPLLLLAGLWAAGGHCSYALLKIFFPIPMICVVARGSITTPIIVLGLIQFPLYGLILGSLCQRHHFRYFAIG